MDALPVAPSVAVPIVTAPSLNATVPVGTPVAGATGRTVAVSVTACPTVDGFGEDVRLVVVDPRTKIFPVTLKRLVWTVLTPGPPTLGPLRLKKLVPSPTNGCGRVPLEERPDVGVGESKREVTGRGGGEAALVVREIDRAGG